MKRILLSVLLAVTLVASAPPPKPKLVVAIVIDQFRYDYLTRFRSEYTAGFDRLLTRGAVFTNATYQHFPTVTAVGHSTFLSGALPSISGIIGNDWYDRDEGHKVTSVSDPKTQLLGGAAPAEGSSPRRMMVDTIGDELKMEDAGKSHVIGVSLKDRAAILPAGHMADGAFWFDPKSGNFVSSTYYFTDLPGWVKDFDAGRPADRYHGAAWLTRKLPESGPKLYSAIDASPFGNEMVEAFAERAIQAEQLGKHDVTDLLAVSFSSNDYVGHQLGPDSPEVHEMAVRTDRVLARLFAAVDHQVGLDNALIVLTADHGVAPVPEVNAARKMPGGRMPLGLVTKTVHAALVAKYGEGDWIVNDAEHSLYFNLALEAQKKLDPAEVNRTAAGAIRVLPHVFRVYTREDLVHGEALPDPITRRVENGYYIRRGPDIELLLEPYWIFGQTGTTHGTGFDYDTHVPVIFMGRGIKPGRYYQSITPNDVAPTLAAILDVETPAGSVGRVLSAIIQ